jgi:hypothetical protein
MEPIVTIVNAGKYKFQIIDNTLLARGQIYCRNFKIGGRGNNSDCVNVSITYNQNQPVSACIPYVVYDPDCSIDIPLDRGQGSVIMIKTLLQYIHRQIPSIKEISFEDKSNIECATEYEIQKKGSRFRKKGTHVYPIPLYYFSIAFNGETWYEKYFNARQKDRNKHDKYRAKIDNLLYSEELKTNTSFLRFLEIAQPPVELIDELEHYYNKSGTFKDFFQSIPKSERCKLTRDWISTFMSYHLKDVFENTDWLIDLIDEKGAGRRKTRKYYCPTGFIMHNKTYKDFGIDIISF